MDVLKVLAKEKRRFFSLKNKRICCSLTGHEMPTSADALLAYANGKKFERALVKHAASLSVPSELRGFLIDATAFETAGSAANGGGAAGDTSSGAGPSNHPHRRLFCQLTCRFVADTPADVARHTGGRRFRAALAAYQAARAAGQPYEPNTSLYKKSYCAHMTLEGLAGASNASAGNGEGEEDDDEPMDEEDEEKSSSGVEEDAADDEPMEEALPPSPPPTKKPKQNQQLQKQKRKLAETQGNSSAGKKRKK